MRLTEIPEPQWTIQIGELGIERVEVVVDLFKLCSVTVELTINP